MILANQLLFLHISLTSTHAPITGTVSRATIVNCQRNPLPTVRREVSKHVKSGMKKLLSMYMDRELCPK